MLFYVEESVKADMDTYEDIPHLPPLLNAVHFKDIERVTSLLEEKTDPNYVLEYQHTPLQVAACKGNLEIMDILLKYGANIDAKNVPEGKAALTRAAIEGRFDAVVFLVERGADVNTCCSHNTTPFGGAAFNNRAAIMFYLIRKGAKITEDLRYLIDEAYRFRNLLTMGILCHFGANESMLESGQAKETLKMGKRYYDCYDAVITFMLCFKQVYKINDVNKIIAVKIWNTHRELCWNR